MDRARPLLLLLLPLLLVTGAAVPSAPAVAADTAPTPAAPPYTVLPDDPLGYRAVHELTVVLIAPAGIEPEYTREDVLQTIRRVDAFYDRETDGLVRFTAVSVSDWVTPDDPALRCDDEYGMEGFAARYAHWTRGADKHLMAMVPNTAKCGDYSAAEFGRNLNDGQVGYFRTDDTHIVGHELGHNLTITHDPSVQCPDGWDFDDPDEVPASCTRDEYGDPLDIMGFPDALYPFSASSLARLGMIDMRAVPTCGATRRIPIHTLGAGYHAQRIISWDDPAAPDVTYYVQYRDAADRLVYDAIWPQPEATRFPSGVQIQRSDPRYSNSSVILSRPGDPGDARQLIRAGESVALDHGMTVTVAALDEVAHTAEVDVTVPCGAPAPPADPVG